MSQVVNKLIRFAVKWTPRSVRRSCYALPFVGPRFQMGMKGLLHTGATEWVEFDGGALAGCRLKLQLPCESEFYLETHDPDVTSLIRQRIAQGDSVIEIGAHIGYFSLLICKAIGPTGRLFALEALPSNYQRLCEHLAENGFESRARVFSLAGSAEDGTATLLEFEHSTIARLASAETVVQDKPTDQRLVACRSVDSLVDAGEVDKPTFVKVDVEGAEYDVILGMRSVIDRYRPELLIEMHNEKVGRQVTDFLTGQGYLVYRSDGPTLSLLDRAVSTFTGLNLLFVPRERIYSS